MTESIKFGLFGDCEVTRDDDGFIEHPVIIQESGLYGGASPVELRIHTMGVWGDDDFNKRYVAKLNEKTDLPFYLATAKIKVLPGTKKCTIESIKEEGLEPLK